jgi:hypothetical protein
MNTSNLLLAGYLYLKIFSFTIRDATSLLERLCPFRVNWLFNPQATC